MPAKIIGPRHVVGELVRTRGLILTLTVRELKARYRGSVFGYLWTLLNPLMLLAIYWLVFSVYVRGEGLPKPYAVFMFTGLVCWLWLGGALNKGTTTIVRNHPMITHGPFPPQILPTVEVCAEMLHCLMSVPVLIAAIYLSGLAVGAGVVLLPLLLVLQLAFILGLVLASSSLTVFYRDVQFIINNLVTFWFFLTPGILYPLEMAKKGMASPNGLALPEPLASYAAAAVHYLNPMAPLIQCWQAIFFRGGWPDPTDLAVFALHAAVALTVGLLIFARYRYPLVEEI